MLAFSFSSQLMQPLFDLIRSIKPMSDGFDHELSTFLTPHRLRKHEVILQAGTTSNRIFFIETGLTRRYYLKDDKEITTDFMREGDFILSPLSFYTRQPSFEFVETLEASVLWSISRPQLEFLYDKFPAFNAIGRVLTEQYYVKSELRAHSLRHLSAEDRYEQFFHTHKDLLNRLPGKHVATLLGLTPETYSRIRAKKAKA